jgi:Bacterial mobilisation protein (MobC)
MARHRTHADAIRSKIISIRVKPEDYERLKLDASWTGQSVSGLAEQLVRKGKIVVTDHDRPAPLHPALMSELRRIGNNLNQIAHAVNSNLPPSVRETSDTLSQLIQQLSRDELLSQRVKAAASRMPSNDSSPPQARSEFQRSVQLHPARPRQSD